MLYVLKADGADGFKVGFSYSVKHLEGRIKILQTGCPLPLRIVALKHEGTLQDEDDLHAVIAHSRIFGEWFRASPLLLHFIKDYPSDDATVFGVPQLKIGRAMPFAGSVWKKTGVKNLALSVNNGRYYLRARVGRKNPYKEALGTSDFETAVSRLNERLGVIRAEAAGLMFEI